MCAALYYEPQGRELGAWSFGPRGFGGILENWDRAPDEATKWIPQYNLQLYWRRQIPPTRLGFVEPLIPARFRKTRFTRLPGHFSRIEYDYNVDNRNLLAARYYNENDEDQGFVRIWTVNERSRRHYVEQMDVLISKKGLLKKDSYAPENVIGWKIVEPLMELRTSNWYDDAIFIRSNCSLMFKKDSETDQTKLFQNAVTSFDESKVMSGELAMVDYDGMVWLNDMEKAATSRVKCVSQDKVYKRVSFCNHPRTLAVSTDTEVVKIDVREPLKTTKLFESMEFETRKHQDSLYIREEPFESPRIQHLAQLEDVANMFLVMTNFGLHLVDDRFPGKNVLTIKHAFLNGGHKMITSRPILDTENGGNVYGVFLLDQLLTGISLCKIYHHTCQLWSSVSHFERVGDSNDYEKIVRRGKHASEVSLPDDPVRAMAVIDMVKDRKGYQYTCLLRQNDDGSIWWQRFANFGVAGTKIMREEEKSCERIGSYKEKLQEEPNEEVYVQELDSNLRENVLDRRKIICVDADLERKFIRESWKRAEEEARKVGGLYLENGTIEEEIQVQALYSEDATLSKIIEETWRKAHSLMQNIDRSND